MPHVPEYQNFAPPVGKVYKEGVFGTSIKRLTDARATPNAAGRGNLNWIGTEYSTCCPFNCDNTRLLLLHESYYGLYDGDGVFIRNLPFSINASSEPRWSRKFPDFLFYVNGNKVLMYDSGKDESRILRAFTEYAGVNGAGESDISEDGNHLVLCGDGHAIFVYDLLHDTKGPVLETEGHAFDSLYITPDNQFTVTWKEPTPKGISGQGPRFTGIELFEEFEDPKEGPNIRFVWQLAHAGGHMDLCRDCDGEPCLVWCNSGDKMPTCGSNALVKIRLRDGLQTCLLSLDWALNVHISGTDKGYVFVETYRNPGETSWPLHADELFRVSLNPDGLILRLAHHRSLIGYQGDYVSQPKLSVSRDGSKLVWASNFDAPPNSAGEPSRADVYMTKGIK